ncbi:hypothetical protein ACIBK8_25060 [Streptomyces sp. NPDC050161]|uniref:hypothetical protein n=1 Tax=Streptomyces sp. NPDC050161 TaxID=3365604 RepID=UPI00379381A0
MPFDEVLCHDAGREADDVLLQGDEGRDGVRTGLLDDIVGGGFRLLVTEQALRTLDLPTLEQVGITVVGFGPSATNRVVSTGLPSHQGTQARSDKTGGENHCRHITTYRAT